MMDKNALRKKAMEMMRREGPSIAIQIAKKSSMDDMPMGGDDEQAEGEMSGMISMMVTPKEKEMIIQMRKEEGSKDEEPSGGDIISELKNKSGFKE